MNRKSINGAMAGLLMTLGAGVAAPTALAHGGGGPMMGPGMMGPGMMGPGMMGGMGRMGMMGHMGMMGGLGGGMMGGMGHMGMMGGMRGGMGPIWMLDLNDDQRAKLRDISNELRKKNWDTMGKIMDEKSKLSGLYGKEARDPKAIGAVYGKIFAYKRQMIEAKIDASNRMQAVLTKEQREQLKKMRRGMGPGSGGGMGPRGAPQGKGMMGG